MTDRTTVEWWKYGLAILAAWLAGIAVGLAYALATIDYGQFPSPAFGGLPESIHQTETIATVALVATLLAVLGWVYVDYVYARGKSIGGHNAE